MGENYEIVSEIHRKYLKFFLSKTSILKQTWHKASLGERYSSLFNEGPRPFQVDLLET